jgi:hypothetical protein
MSPRDRLISNIKGTVRDFIDVGALERAGVDYAERTVAFVDELVAAERKVSKPTSAEPALLKRRRK